MHRNLFVCRPKTYFLCRVDGRNLLVQGRKIYICGVVYATFCRQLTSQALVGNRQPTLPAAWSCAAVKYRSICHIDPSIDPSDSCTQDATRSEFDPVESSSPIDRDLESSLICLKRVKKRDIAGRAVGECSLSLGNPDQGRLCWGWRAISNEPSAPLALPDCLAQACWPAHCK